MEHLTSSLLKPDTLDHRRQTQGPQAESGPPPSFLRPGTLFLLPGSSAKLSLNL